MDDKRIYNIGQILTVQRDIETERVFGEKEIIKKGTQVYVGADGFVHYKDGSIQALGKNIEIKGYSVSGLADFIWLYIRNLTPIDEETLEYYEETPDCIKNAIIEALEELGFYDDIDNKK